MQRPEPPPPSPAIEAPAIPNPHVEVIKEARGWRLVWRGPAPLVGARAGDVVVERLAPGESVEVPASERTGPPTLMGRFPLESWHLALQGQGATDEGLKAFHECTAGIRPDAMDPGPLGDPDAGANRRALRAAEPELLKRLVVGEDPARLRWLAHAARTASPELWVAITRSTAPGDETLTPLMKTAFEAQGSRLLSRSDPQPPRAWLEITGLRGSHLGLWSERRVCMTAPQDQPPGFVQAHEQGEFVRALRLASDRLLPCPEHQPGKALGPETRAAACMVVDSGAWWLISHGHLASAEFVLGRVRSQCKAVTDEAFKARLASIWQARGDRQWSQGDLVGAERAWREGLSFWPDPLTASEDLKIRMADVLAERARLAWADGRFGDGDALLAEARQFGADRPTVLRTEQDRPRIDVRVRWAIMGLGMVVMWFALRRLRRALRRGRPVRWVTR